MQPLRQKWLLSHGRQPGRTTLPEEIYFICRVAEGRAKGIPVNEALKPVKLILDLKLVSAPSLLDLEEVDDLWLTYFLSAFAQIPANGTIGKSQTTA